MVFCPGGIMPDTFLSWFTDAGKFTIVMTVTGRYDSDGLRDV